MTPKLCILSFITICLLFIIPYSTKTIWEFSKVTLEDTLARFVTQRFTLWEWAIVE